MAKPRKAADGSHRSARRAARLAAVQALYQLDMNAGSARAVIAEFVTHRLGRTEDRAEADQALFTDIVGGVTERVAEIDGLVGAALVEGWTVARLETVLRAILRAATFEMLARPDIPPRVTITEYVDIAHAFFGGREPALVNGVLDKLGQQLRSHDLKVG